MTAWPCEKFMVRLVTQVMWYPRATSPYMLPRANPVTMSWTTTLLHRDGQNLAALPDHQDVVLVGERVVLFRREGSLVGLDQALVFVLEVLQRVAELDPVGRAGLRDGLGHQVQSVIGVGNTDGGDDLFRTLDAVLVLEPLQDILPALILFPEERVGLEEDHPVGELARQLGEPATR